MANYGRSRHTTATPAEVWDVWSDPATWHEWNPSVTRMELDRPLADGTTGRMHTPTGRVYDVRFDAVRPGESYDMHTKVIPGTAFRFRCEITPDAQGATVRQTVHLTGPMAVVFGPLAGPGMARSFDKVLDGLVAAVEHS